ncbi:MAG: DUF2304 family protein [Bacteriovoracia bacterium]
MIRIFLLSIMAIIAFTLVFHKTTSAVRAWKKLIFLLIIGLGALAVLFPSKTTVVANFIGVGRGTDLLLYVVTMVILTYVLGSYIESKRSSRREAILVKEIALIRSKIEDLEKKTSDI